MGKTENCGSWFNDFGLKRCHPQLLCLTCKENSCVRS